MPRENVSSSSSTDLEMAASEASAESGRDGREKKVEMGPKTPPPKLETQRSELDVDRGSYVDSLRLVLRTLPAAVDHLSDIPVLAFLWATGYTRLFWIGLAIDLLPGPVAAYQFFLLGHRRSAFLLLCHPLNVFLWTILAVCKVNAKLTNFARTVVAYYHESQALLESPLQVIFNLSLICHGILPAPWDKGFSFSNAWGNEINLSFLPTLSILLSLFSILLNAGGTVNLLDNLTVNPKRSLTWILFLLSNILFRLQAWVLLATYLDVYALPVVVLTFAFNLVSLVLVQKTVKVDPVLSAVLSLVFPVTFMKSIYQAEQIEAELGLVKRMQKLLSLFGTCVLIVALWTLYTVLPHLQYNPQIILSRDVLYHFLVSCTVLGAVAVCSTFFISLPGPAVRVLRRVSMAPVEAASAVAKKFNMSDSPAAATVRRRVSTTAEHFSNWPLPSKVRTRMGFSLGARVALVLLVLMAVAAPYYMPRSWNKTEVHVTVCGEPLSSSSSSFNDSFSMSHHGKEGETQMGLLRNCKDDLDSEITQSLGNNFELLTCLESSGSTKLILLDNAFSTRIPSELDKEDVLLVRKRSPELPQLWEGIRRLARCASDPRLVEAARAGDEEAVVARLKTGVQIDATAPADGQTALSAAAQRGHLEIAKYLIDQGANVSAATSFSRMRPMHYAAMSKTPEMITLLSSSGASVDAANIRGETPLIVAIREGNNDVARELLVQSADYRIKDKRGNSPLSAALEDGNERGFELLWTTIASGPEGQAAAEALVKGEEGGRLLVAAAEGGLLEASKQLLSSGADLSHRAENGDSALNRAAAGNHTEVAMYLIESGADVNYAGAKIYAPLHWAVTNENLPLTETLVSSGANVSAECKWDKPYFSGGKLEKIAWSEDGRITPLLMAAKFGFAEIVKYLATEGGADVNQVDTAGQNGLHKAAFLDADGGDHDEVFKVLIKAGADMKLKDKGGDVPVTLAGKEDAVRCLRASVEAGFDLSGLVGKRDRNALHFAARYGKVDVVRYLMEDVPAVGRKLALIGDKRTNMLPIHLAPYGRKVEVIRLLTEGGASPLDAQTAHQFTPLDYAASDSSAEIVEALIDAGADVNFTNPQGISALMRSLVKSNDGATRVLLDHSADAEARDIHGRTAMFQCHSEGMARLMLEHGADFSVMDNQLNTVLHVAAMRGLPGVVRFCLELGMDRSALNEEGLTPLDMANKYSGGAGPARDSPEKEEVRRLLQGSLDTLG